MSIKTIPKCIFTQFSKHLKRLLLNLQINENATDSALKEFMLFLNCGVGEDS